jgi:hypothetical protein
MVAGLRLSSPGRLQRNERPGAGWLIFESPSRLGLLFEHDRFGKPLSTFPDHAQFGGAGYLM